MSTVLVVAAHPDDEILGVGGTVARHAAKGDHVFGYILGEGQTSRWKERELAEEKVIQELHKNTWEAAKVVGYKNIFFADLPDNRFDQVDLLDIVKLVEEMIQQVQPEIIYTHHLGDLNIDHQRTGEAVITATRPLQNGIVKEIYTFETLSSTEWDFSYRNSFCPNVFIEVADFFEKKVEAMKCYESELCEFPHPRSVKGLEILAQKWGMTVGKNYVEAFQLVRKIQD
ncbi:PIG-L deacetylase family protein [Anaeromicropila populeti]|uniref:N-acetylglucosaminyl deacetylase, LmbE family n=1 Tax=Anaeromicropila populeti TaxID=37658 RepID=A0A1I6HVM2_9FIRM|nr:PIG-L family deacetylase [Anaeromicropila populeti]SFR58512.1 N-acetylglucosaminyl deacetylase, LmbE family [Anaeromicropila populeti]